MLSSYPNSKTYSNYEYDNLPSRDSQAYRMQFNRNYLWDKWIDGYFHHISPMREALEDKKWLDDYDQDHALILTEGTNVGIFQSIMLKPPNVQAIYPLRDTSDYRTVTLDPTKKGPIIVVAIEAFGQQHLMKQNKPSKNYYIKTIFEQLQDLEQTLGPDFDLVVISEINDGKTMNGDGIRNMTSNSTHVISSSMVSHIRFEEETSRPTVYIGQCTQMNLLAAIENFKAPIIGFANPLVHTQVFNCHKLNTENAGIPVDLLDQSLDIKATIKKILADESMF